MRTKIGSFRDLGDNWDKCGAEPLCKKTIILALEIVDCLPKNFDWHVAADPDGSISFEDGKTGAIIEVWHPDPE